MRRNLHICCALLLCLTASACLQRTDSQLASVSGTRAGVWELAGSFGGTLDQLPEASAFAATRRVALGQFAQISGLCATDEEVYVCDMGRSLVQVFDFNGNFLRSIGSGVTIAGNLPDDERVYYEMTDINRNTEQFWEDTPPALPWLTDRANYFRAADVAAVDGGIWIADQVRSGGRTKPLRAPGIMFIGDDGSVDTSLTRKDFVWPDFLSVEGQRICFTETRGNSLVLGEKRGDDWSTRSPSPGVRFRDLMRIEKENKGTSAYLELVLANTNASVQPGKFNGLGGICIAFDKLVACDSGNSRLQVFELRTDQATKWGGVIRVIDRSTPRGHMRFDSCDDIDIDSNGVMYVLDKRRSEIAVLDQTFERLGSFGAGELIEPHAIDLSDDARHLFVSDRRFNQVHHFVRTD